MNFPPETLFELGRVRKIHGLNGEVVVSVQKFALPILDKIEIVFLELGISRLPFFIQSISGIKENVLVSFKGVQDAQKAELLVGAKLYAKRDLFPPKESKDFYPFEVIGFQANDIHIGEIGTIIKVEESPGQDILVILKADREVLVPIVPHFINHLDRESKVMVLDLPDGLVDIYLSDTS